jgi:hypothetical protein
MIAAWHILISFRIQKKFACAALPDLAFRVLSYIECRFVYRLVLCVWLGAFDGRWIVNRLLQMIVQVQSPNKSGNARIIGARPFQDGERETHRQHHDSCRQGPRYNPCGQREVGSNRHHKFNLVAAPGHVGGNRELTDRCL